MFSVTIKLIRPPFKIVLDLYQGKSKVQVTRMGSEKSHNTVVTVILFFRVFLCFLTRLVKRLACVASLSEWGVSLTLNSIFRTDSPSLLFVSETILCFVIFRFCRIWQSVLFSLLYTLQWMATKNPHNWQQWSCFGTAVLSLSLYCQ